ncbi:insulinase family protein [Colwellia demingiae]|uniref:Insulinase family protein n=1 Tax=Colwellia demingiae TaxID=89401 RepID=A0A5C6QDI7_9GAMM|nr:insulinase family protein [Colwellia demingiae]TWX66727.1 insulinase family protein [Colwellia demingiae]
MTSSGQIKRHPNGLQHQNINDNRGFSALIVVNTPALDDSGVSHAVEHLVFRRSKAFNHAESLFQLTALTDLSINASTHYNVTYYHCHSQCLQTCLLGLNYLFNGLLAPEFVTQDLAHEIYHDDCYGVINRELTPQQGQANQQRVIDRSDTSAQRCYQYGGDLELISTLTLSDITRYHAQYYQAKKMYLVTGNIEPTLIDSLLESINDTTKNDVPYCPKVLPKAYFLEDEHYEINHFETDHFEAKKQLFRWYIDEEFFAYFTNNYKSLSHLIESYDALLISPQYNLNNKQQFALDIIAPMHCSETVLSQALASFLLKNPEDKSIRKKEKPNKFSPEIIRLFNYYQRLIRDLESDLASNLNKELNQGLNQNLTKKQSLYSNKQTTLVLGHGSVYPLKKQPLIKQQQTKKPIPLLPVANLLLIQLSQHLSEGKHQQSEYKHRPLPAVLSPLLIQAQQQLIQHQEKIAEVFDPNHCLILININDTEQNLAILTSFILNAYPTFIASRTQGHCYAIASQYLIDSHHLAFYSAFDVAPCVRFLAINESLKSLSKDLQFIAATLPLAKSKLKSVDLDDVTDNSVAEFISKHMLANDA